jgi:hypothetical protein
VPYSRYPFLSCASHLEARGRYLEAEKRSKGGVWGYLLLMEAEGGRVHISARLDGELMSTGSYHRG